MSAVPQCPICQRWSAGNKTCEQVACLACGTVQCFLNGSRSGQCRHCHYGVLPGWAGAPKTCGYKGCAEPAVYKDLPGGKRGACKAHGSVILARQEARRQEAQAKRETWMRESRARWGTR